MKNTLDKNLTKGLYLTSPVKYAILMRYLTPDPGRTVNRRAREALVHVLPPTADIRPKGDRVLVNGKPLLVRWIGEGWLAEARDVLEASPRPDIVVATSVSPGARQVLANAGIGWVDETGAAEIAVGSIIVSKSGRRPVERDDRLVDWTPAVLAVTEAVLCGTKPTVSATQDVTGLSVGSCTNALRFLTERELLFAEAQRGRSSGRRIRDFKALLHAYAAAVADADPPMTVRVGVTWRDPVLGLAKTAERWSRRGHAWACTGAVAASVLAPHLTSVGGADVYVEADTFAALESVARDAGLEPIEGGRLSLRPFPTVAARRMSTKKHGLNVAPWPRVYADLRLVGVRGEEAAEHLLEVMHDG